MYVAPRGLLSLHLKQATVPITAMSIQNSSMIEHNSPSASTSTYGSGMAIKHPRNHGIGNLKNKP